MAEHHLIAAYRDDLLSQLPADLADEVSDGLADAHEKYLSQGLDPTQAATAAIDEFGSARLVADAFRRACPAWRAARALMLTGPAVGGCWAAALIADRAWEWPVPAPALLVLGLVLATSVALLMAAVQARRYQTVSRTGLAACLGTATLDISVVTTAFLLAPSLRWLFFIAASASAARLTFVVCRMRRLVSRATM